MSKSNIISNGSGLLWTGFVLGIITYISGVWISDSLIHRDQQKFHEKNYREAEETRLKLQEEFPQLFDEYGNYKNVNQKDD